MSGKMTWKLVLKISAFMFLIGIVAPLHAQGGKAVIVETTIKPSELTADHFTIAVELEIKDGWHTYAQLPDDSPSMATKAKLTLPAGVEAVGEWNVPDGNDYAKEPGATIFEGKVRLTRDVKAIASPKQQSIGVQINYQACNDKSCMPPKRLKATVSLPAATGAANSKLAVLTKKRVAPASAKAGEKAGEKASEKAAAMEPAKDAFPKLPPAFENKFFDAPVRLMVGKEPLNLQASQMYPSPAMFDVDNDGDVELVVGDIFGSLNVYENENATGKGDPVWAKHVALANGEKKAIKVSNW